MKILYVYPHPDDETFGPAPVIAQQRRQGHEVHLLTLTRGGATKQRFKYNYSIAEMGAVRFKEMQAVARVLDLTSMTVLDLPDDGLKELDPRQIEIAIQTELEKIRPEVLVTYTVHGISGFHDHLVCHAAVKRVYCDLKQGDADYLKRLALSTVTEQQAGTPGLGIKLHSSKTQDIDCLVSLKSLDIEAFNQALDCYVTYKDAIEKSGVKNVIFQEVAFEFFQEAFDPPVKNLTFGI